MNEHPTTYQATWNGIVLAESDHTVQVEGNQYFPPDAVNADYLRSSGTTTVCPWKGTASYYTLEVAGKTNPDAAWYYPHPSPAAHQIKDYVAFWHGVQVTKTSSETQNHQPGNKTTGLLDRLFGIARTKR